MSKEKRCTTDTGLLFHQQKTLQKRVNPNPGEARMLVGASQSAGSRSHKVDLQLQLRPPPVSPLCVVPDRVAGPHPDPLGDGPVLLALLGKDPLDAERLQSRHLTTVTSLVEVNQAIKA